MWVKVNRMKLLNVDTIEQVQEKLHGYFVDYKPMVETISIRFAVGRYLAQEITTDMDMPPFRRSVVDGYAVMAKDTFGVSDSIPVFLDVLGTVEMGQSCHLTLKPGQAIYVPTGGMLPSGADSMVMIEYVEKLDEKTIAVYKSATPNGGIMNQGDDFKLGQLLFEKGHRITKKDIGMMATVGCSQILVYEKAVISIISTGDEIIDITEVPQIGQIRDINSYTIAAFAEDAGAKIESMTIVKDTREQLTKAVSQALKNSHIILLSGGSSAGNKDMTADIIDEMGMPGVLTHGIAMKPGKPTIVGVLEQKDKDQMERQDGELDFNSSSTFRLAVGLPGHPMAAIMAYLVIVETFIKKYYFHNQGESFRVKARISENLHAGEGRETFQLVTLCKDQKSASIEADTDWVASPIHAKSGSISQLMYADGYIRMSALSEGLNAGEPVEVILINR